MKDIAKIYKKFIEKKIISGIYDVGTGSGYLIKDIVDFSNFKNSRIIKINNIDEVHNSVAQNQNFNRMLKNFKFLNLGIYLKKKLKINKKIIEPTINQKKEVRISTLDGVVIYGAGDAGKQIYHELNKNNENTLFYR